MPLVMMLILLLASPSLAADAPWVHGCPPLAWDRAHPNDCRHRTTNATVLGVCCDQMHANSDHVQPKQCQQKNFGYVKAIDTCSAADPRETVDPICCHPEKW